MTDMIGRKVAVITAEFYPDLSRKFIDGVQRKFQEFGGRLSDLRCFSVPGAFEIPQVAQKIITQNRYYAILCFGAVISCETAHFDYVCDNVTRGIGTISRNADIPVIFSILTTDTKLQAEARLGGEHSHKGEEAIESAMMMIHTLKEIK